MIAGSTEKFTGKAEAYSAARPGYPKEFVDYLCEKVGINSGSTVADIGSGTGKFSVELLKIGAETYCVEPNDDMRGIAERDFAAYPNFHSVKGTCENTGLGENSLDFITVAQAFHWFDADKFKTECRRILKYHGIVILMWNTRTECKFNSENHAIFEKYCPEFNGFSSEKRDSVGVEHFFGGNFTKVKFSNPYILNKAAFIARCESGSYSLTENHPDYSEYIQALGDLFDKYAKDGTVEIPSETVAYIGKI